MKITAPGRYILTRDFGFRGPLTIVNFPAGTTLQITQVDPVNNKVIGPDLPDWASFELPVEPVCLATSPPDKA